MLHVLAAVDRKGKMQIEEGGEKKQTLKSERENKRKATAGKEFNWSMLYMNVCCLRKNCLLLSSDMKGHRRVMLLSHPSPIE